MPAKLLSSIVSVALVLALGACGGDDNGEKEVATTPPSTASETAESTTGKADTAPAKPPKESTAPAKPPKESTSGKAHGAPADAKELAACLKKAGYEPTVIPAPPKGVPGAEFGSIGTVRVNVGSSNGVAAVFFKDAKKAKALKKRIGKGGLGGRGTVEVIDAVYVATNRGRPKALGAFRTCLKR